MAHLDICPILCQNPGTEYANKYRRDFDWKFGDEYGMEYGNEYGVEYRDIPALTIA